MNKDIMQEMIQKELKVLLPKFNDETYDFVSKKITETIFEELLKAPKELKLSWKDYPHLVGFNRWVVEQYEKDSGIGAVCRDLTEDMNWPFRSNSYEEMKKHLQVQKVSKQNMKGFNIMYETYLSETSDFQKELESIDGTKAVRPDKSKGKTGSRSKGNPRKG